METKKEIIQMLDLMIRPGFIVEKNRITLCNAAAQAMAVAPGTDIRELLLTGSREYDGFTDGCLYLQLSVRPGGCGATVVRRGGCDLFCLDQDADDALLRSMALSSRILRDHVNELLVLSRDLNHLLGSDSPEAVRLRKKIYQMQRILGNMADAGWYPARLENRNFTAVTERIMENTRELVAHTGIELQWQGLQEPVWGAVDEEKLERAVLNLLSNALRHTPRGGTIQVSLTRRGQMLQLAVRDSGSGIPEGMLGSVFSRYLRQPGIEDPRNGVGLGMVLVRKTAAIHGGTVLLDCPAGGGTRIVMTLAIRSGEAPLRSPIMYVDYAGEADHGLVELADYLPDSLYE